MANFKYNMLYNHLKEQITSGQIEYGRKLPSVRQAGELYSVSRTTVQNAYFELSADGYIISVPQSGYYVEYKSQPKESENKNAAQDEILYNFTGETADRDSFNFALWKRYMKSALRDDEKLLSYSPAQGEYELRCAISDYIREKRNVAAAPERIVVGAGTYTLLNILCSLLEKKGTVSLPAASFRQGAAVFGDYGFDVHYRYKDADIIYVSPSHMTHWGSVMPNKRRHELVNYSAKTGSLIIEDDYESDFLYNTQPAPSLYALSGGKNVVYMGSFSKLLLPSIRISFMVLTRKLADEFTQSIYKYNQTASKTEQLALSQYIRDGHLKAQIRKTRRFYTSKTRELYALLQCEFSNAKIQISENMLQIIMEIPFCGEPESFAKNKTAVNIDSCENGRLRLVLSSASIKSGDLKAAVGALKASLR
ncbi:MAG: PLP-dependent aminotransferase family protein [Clostridiales bacterium]|nr:PLP-dependent aminotransferase family protein [Clostridiales bacterium]